MTSQLVFNQHPDELLTIKLTAIRLNTTSKQQNISFKFKQIKWGTKSEKDNCILISITNEQPCLVAYDSIRIDYEGITNNEQFGIYDRLTENDIIPSESKKKIRTKQPLFPDRFISGCAAKINPMWDKSLQHLTALIKKGDPSLSAKFHYFPIKDKYQPNQPHSSRIFHQIVTDNLTIEVTEGESIYIPDQKTMLKQYTNGLIKLKVMDGIDIVHLIDWLNLSRSKLKG